MGRGFVTSLRGVPGTVTMRCSHVEPLLARLCLDAQWTNTCKVCQRKAPYLRNQIIAEFATDDVYLGTYTLGAGSAEDG